jgi:hypothetical protein
MYYNLMKGAKLTVSCLGLIALGFLFIGLGSSGVLMLAIPSYSPAEADLGFKVRMLLTPILWTPSIWSMLHHDYDAWTRRAWMAITSCIVLDLIFGLPYTATPLTLLSLAIQRLVLATDPTVSRESREPAIEDPS